LATFASVCFSYSLLYELLAIGCCSTVFRHLTDDGWNTTFWSCDLAVRLEVTHCCLLVHTAWWCCFAETPEPPHIPS